ncbi:hypothetical protein GH714_041426 [Hevea brasiliensis]|uniref:Sugar phosphate transporter domain-containing protein n=1 Tax=Hevea brasiliensis TaxID=3981 RepID=A0A6A6N1R8_HEVBR|nr:hypothetical protein GH714_041418 [Hevea brasiliensis]KAF2318085.1 hypothetical protein GH714_041426 [Hevea brasiliensis]
MDESGHHWNLDLVNGLFQSRDVKRIPVSGLRQQDIWVRHHAKTGVYSVKSAYYVARGIDWGPGVRDGFGDCFSRLLDVKDSERVSVVGAVAWSVWSCRNQRRWKGGPSLQLSGAFVVAGLGWFSGFPILLWLSYGVCDRFSIGIGYRSKLGVIAADCRALLRQGRNSSLSGVPRQANILAHAIARASPVYAFFGSGQSLLAIRVRCEDLADRYCSLCPLSPILKLTEALSAMDLEKNKTLPVTDPSSKPEKLQNDSVMTRKGAYAAICYMASAVLLVMFNKAALSSYNFPHANVITLFQSLCSCSFLYAMRRWKIISFRTAESNRINNNPASFVPFKTLFHTLPLALSYLLYMLVTMESVRGINVPMYTTLRRTTVAFTMIVEYLTGKRHSLLVIGSVGIIMLGAFIAGARDLSFDAYSYGIVFIANICTAIYLASISRIGKSSGLNSYGLMWCNGEIRGPT